MTAGLKKGAAAAFAGTLLLCAWSRSAHAQTSAASDLNRRWWLAAGLGETVVPPFHEKAGALSGEFGIARGPFELVLHKSFAFVLGGSERSGVALLAGASAAGRFLAGHASLGVGEVGGCDRDGESNPCDGFSPRVGPAFRVGVDLFVGGAFGVQARYQGIGYGPQAYRPFTAGLVLGRLRARR